MIAEARFSWRGTQASAIVAMLSPAPSAIGTSFWTASSSASER